MGACPFAEYLKDQAGAVDNLCLPTFFEIALLHRRKCAVDDNKSERVVLDPLGDMFDRAAAEQGCRPRPGDLRDLSAHHIKVDRSRQTDRFFKPRFYRTRRLAVALRGRRFRGRV